MRMIKKKMIKLLWAQKIIELLSILRSNLKEVVKLVREVGGQRMNMKILLREFKNGVKTGK
jgi:hypothetical protein